MVDYVAIGDWPFVCFPASAMHAGQFSVSVERSQVPGCKVKGSAKWARTLTDNHSGSSQPVKDSPVINGVDATKRVTVFSGLVALDYLGNWQVNHGHSLW